MIMVIPSKYTVNNLIAPQFEKEKHVSFFLTYLSYYTVMYKAFSVFVFCYSCEICFDFFAN
jgi:hypothetical protein